MFPGEILESRHIESALALKQRLTSLLKRGFGSSGSSFDPNDPRIKQLAISKIREIKYTFENVLRASNNLETVGAEKNIGSVNDPVELFESDNDADQTLIFDYGQLQYLARLQNDVDCFLQMQTSFNLISTDFYNSPVPLSNTKPASAPLIGNDDPSLTTEPNLSNLQDYVFETSSNAIVPNNVAVPIFPLPLPTPTNAPSNFGEQFPTAVPPFPKVPTISETQTITENHTISEQPLAPTVTNRSRICEQVAEEQRVANSGPQPYPTLDPVSTESLQGELETSQQLMKTMQVYDPLPRQLETQSQNLLPIDEEEAQTVQNIINAVFSLNSGEPLRVPKRTLPGYMDPKDDGVHRATIDSQSLSVAAGNDDGDELVSLDFNMLMSDLPMELAAQTVYSSIRDVLLDDNLRANKESLAPNGEHIAGSNCVATIEEQRIIDAVLSQPSYELQVSEKAIAENNHYLLPQDQTLKFGLLNEDINNNHSKQEEKIEFGGANSQMIDKARPEKLLLLQRGPLLPTFDGSTNSEAFNKTFNRISKVREGRIKKSPSKTKIPQPTNVSATLQSIMGNTSSFLPVALSPAPLLNPSSDLEEFPSPDRSLNFSSFDTSLAATPTKPNNKRTKSPSRATKKTTIYTNDIPVLLNPQDDTPAVHMRLLLPYIPPHGKKYSDKPITAKRRKPEFFSENFFLEVDDKEAIKLVARIKSVLIRTKSPLYRFQKDYLKQYEPVACTISLEKRHFQGKDNVIEKLEDKMSKNRLAYFLKLNEVFNLEDPQHLQQALDLIDVMEQVIWQVSLSLGISLHEVPEVANNLDSQGKKNERFINSLENQLQLLTGPQGTKTTESSTIVVSAKTRTEQKKHTWRGKQWSEKNRLTTTVQLILSEFMAFSGPVTYVVVSRFAYYLAQVKKRGQEKRRQS